MGNKVNFFPRPVIFVFYISKLGASGLGVRKLNSFIIVGYVILGHISNGNNKKSKEISYFTVLLH
jgi:hypothetical protein